MISHPAKRSGVRLAAFGKQVGRTPGGPKRFLSVQLLLCFLILPSCGYRVASQNRIAMDVGSVAVVPLENATTTYEVEQFLTRSLIESLVKRTSWKVVESPDRADAVLSGVVSSVRASPVTFGAASFGSTFLVTVTAAVELRDRRNNKVLFRNDRYIFREQYVINSDVESFFSEQSPALQRVAEDFASSVVTSILEGF